MQIIGTDAIEFARISGAELHKFADPVSDHEWGISLERALEVAEEDANLVYTEVDAPGRIDLYDGADLIWSGTALDFAAENDEDEDACRAAFEISAHGGQFVTWTGFTIVAKGDTPNEENVHAEIDE